jgi:hypothetical protein
MTAYEDYLILVDIASLWIIIGSTVGCLRQGEDDEYDQNSKQGWADPICYSPRIMDDNEAADYDTKWNSWASCKVLHSKSEVCTIATLWDLDTYDIIVPL